MKYQILNSMTKGKTACGHTVRKRETYYIIRTEDELRSYCKECTDRMYGDLPIRKKIQAKNLVCENL